MEVRVNITETILSYQYADSNDSQVIRRKVILSIQRTWESYYKIKLTQAKISKNLKKVTYEKIEELDRQGKLGWYTIVTVVTSTDKLYYLCA